jgi:putative ABC transport system permease protein
MREAILQSIENLRANKLRSFLTMFGILWGIVSIVLLSAMGEGFQQGNQKVLTEFGRNVGIVWGGRTSLQAGGERAGRIIRLTVEDVRRLARESRMIERISPEINRGGIQAKSRYNAASVQVHGVEPPYLWIRTVEVDRGRPLNWTDEEQVRRVALVGFDMAQQLFGSRDPVGETIALNGMTYTVVGRIRKKNQDSSYSGPDNGKIFVPFATMARDLPRPDAPPGTVSQILVSPRQWVVDALPRSLEGRTGRVEDIDWPLEREIRGILARHKGFDPEDREAIAMWDTSLSTLMFGRMIGHMRQFFLVVGFVTLALGGVGVMNIMLIAVKDRTREIGVRKALGATTRAVERQFFLEGFFLTALAGGAGLAIGLGLCALVNRAPLPARFAGMIVTPRIAATAIVTLVVVGVAAALLPARRAAELPPTEALRYEM